MLDWRVMFDIFFYYLLVIFHMTINGDKHGNMAIFYCCIYFQLLYGRRHGDLMGFDDLMVIYGILSSRNLT